MIVDQPFGRADDRPARSFLVDGGEGLTMRLSDYGARLVELWVPGRDGQVEDVVLGFDRCEQYAASPHYFGATVGRYGNRISGGRFTLLGRTFQVDRNEGANHLHGGRDGWDRRVWDAECVGTAVTFRTSSAPGEMGFPGACEVTSTYELDGPCLRITMEAVPTETTIVNMVHHSYFNLAGHGSGPVLHQRLRIPADFYTPVDDDLLPTGEIRSVAGTPYDFRQSREIGHGAVGGAYDHNWCLRGDGASLHEAADVHDPVSGRRLRLFTGEPGVQVYTGGGLGEGIGGKAGAGYGRFAGFTLETQKFPDSPRLAHFPTSTVLAGERYRHVMVLSFSTV